MPAIYGFPANLLEEHKQWHRARHNVDPGSPPSGYGEDFLRFHRRYIREALGWYQGQGYNMQLVEPWGQVPEAIRNSACYNKLAESRIINNPQSFRTVDELGRFIESSYLHNCIHQESARLYGEPDLNDFDVAPRSTVFYQIHGMIDRWYQNWEAAMGQAARSMRGNKMRQAAVGSKRKASCSLSRKVRRKAAVTAKGCPCASTRLVQGLKARASSKPSSPKRLRKQRQPRKSGI